MRLVIFLNFFLFLITFENKKIADLQSRVNDMRGKLYVTFQFFCAIDFNIRKNLIDYFLSIRDSIIPPLKKVSKYQTQLEKMRQWTYKLAKMDMRGGLKAVRKEIDLDEKVTIFIVDRIGF